MAKPGRVLIGAIGLSFLIAPELFAQATTPGESPLDFVSTLGRRLSEEVETAELWTIFERCEAELTAEPQRAADAVRPLRPLCGLYAERLGEVARGSERERLIDRLEQAGDGALQPALLKGLLRGRIAERLADLPKAAGPAPVRRSPRDLPERLADAAPELQQAWRLYESLDGAYRDLLGGSEAAGEERLSFFQHRAEFETTLVGLLRDEVPAAEAIAHLSRFEWGGICGRGSQVLHDPRNLGLLLGLLITGDRQAAAGALLRARMGSDLMSTRRQDDRGRDALTRLGFDWEAVALGQMLEGWSETAADLARHGSAQAARLLWQAHSLASGNEAPPFQDDASYLHALAALVAPTDRCSAYGTSSSSDVVRSPDAPLVDADVEGEVLSLLASKVGADAGLSEAETAAHLLVKACRTESLTAFRRMARSPYSRVRDAGSLALRALGERAPSARSNPPVIVHLTVNGAPLDGRVSFSLSRARGRMYEPMQSSTGAARGGILNLDRDRFLDRNEVVETVTVGSGPMTRADDAWFSTTRPRPRDLDAGLRVAIDTQALTLVCPQAETLPLTVTLSAPMSMWGSADMFVPIQSDLTLGPGATSITFPRLQQGRYQWMVSGPDGEFWQSEELNLGGRPLTAACGHLQPLDFEAMTLDSAALER